MSEKQLPNSAGLTEAYGALQEAVAGLLNETTEGLAPNVRALLAGLMQNGVEIIVQTRVPSSRVEIFLDVKGTKVWLVKAGPPLDS